MSLSAINTRDKVMVAAIVVKYREEKKKKKKNSLARALRVKGRRRNVLLFTLHYSTERSGFTSKGKSNRAHRRSLSPFLFLFFLRPQLVIYREWETVHFLLPTLFQVLFFFCCFVSYTAAARAGRDQPCGSEQSRAEQRVWATAIIIMSPKAIYPVLETHKSEKKQQQQQQQSRVALSLIEFGIIILSPPPFPLFFCLNIKKEEVKCDAPELLYCIDVSTPQLFYGHVDEVK